jgi:hypothetical protein
VTFKKTVLVAGYEIMFQEKVKNIRGNDGFKYLAARTG